MRAPAISLQYGETIEIRLRMPPSPPPALRSIAEEYFDSAGLLRREHFPRFHQVLEVFRNADQDAVIYSDVLEYVDRENEISEGLAWERQLLGKLRRGQDPLNGVLKTKLLPYQTQGAIFAASRGRVVLADDMVWARLCRPLLLRNCCGAAEASRAYGGPSFGGTQERPPDDEGDLCRSARPSETDRRPSPA